MSSGRYTSLAVGLMGWLALSAATSEAHAQGAPKAPSKVERGAARDAYDKGTVAFEKGDYVTALDSFVKANALIPSVQAMFWIARAQDLGGKPDAALEAYDAVLARADYPKLSEDKQAVVKERQAALKAQLAPPSAPAPAEPAAPAEPPPEPAPPPPEPFVATPPSDPFPPPIDDPSETRPKKNTAELGLMGGALFLSKSHNLRASEAAPKSDFEIPTWQVGVRAAFFPERVFGIEAEWAHGFGSVEKSAGAAGHDAQFDTVRGHLIGQLPNARAVPFALLGAGILRTDSGNISTGSASMGKDTDFLLEVGIGLKVMATKLIVPRLDARVSMTQKEGGGFADGIAFHPEVLLGLGFTLGR